MFAAVPTSRRVPAKLRKLGEGTEKTTTEQSMPLYPVAQMHLYPVVCGAVAVHTPPFRQGEPAHAAVVASHNETTPTRAAFDPRCRFEAQVRQKSKKMAAHRESQVVGIPLEHVPL
jgi:hypothetical protein